MVFTQTLRDEIRSEFDNDPAAFLRRFAVAITQHQGLKPRPAGMSLNEMIDVIIEAESTCQAAASTDKSSAKIPIELLFPEQRFVAC
jgi:hypothetical protein